MPKQTFFNLPESKKKTLIQAAKQEFSRAPIYQASISNIVKSAGIARGSFYQYFEDKEDIFFFLLDEHAKQRKESFIAALKENDGDIFVTITKIFQLMLEELPTQENRNFFKNAFLHMTHRMESSFSRIFNDNGNGEQLKEMSRLINRANLNFENEREFYHVMQIITTVTFRNFVDKFAKELTNEEVMENFNLEMKLLKDGLYKKR